MVSIVNTILAYATLGADIALVIGFVTWIMSRKTLYTHPLYQWLEQHAILLTGLVALASTLLSLYYSDIVGYAPCKLCWLQRIFIYPQVFLMAVAYKIKDSKVWRYSLPLLIAGILIAIDHVSLQFTGNSLIPCGVPGSGPSCSQQFVMEFGFVTIPVMSLTGFLLMIVFMLILKRKSHSDR